MSTSHPENLSAADALARLRAGNRRYTEERMERPRGDGRRRAELLTGQSPYAVVLTCADSRVAPELVFDEGLGDLFVVRVAGNLLDDALLGSVEYAVANLGVNLVVVMGHDACGAVAAAVAHQGTVGPATGTHIDALIDAIRPAVRQAAAGGDDDLLARSIEQNAQDVADQLRRAQPVLAEHAAAGLAVHSAVYRLGSGEVEFL